MYGQLISLSWEAVRDMRSLIVRLIVGRTLAFVEDHPILTGVTTAVGLGGYALLVLYRVNRYITRRVKSYREYRAACRISDQLDAEREEWISGNTDESYISEVAMEVVGRMGRRPVSSAGVNAARGLAYRIMRENNHRLAHIQRDLPRVLILVQMPSVMERALEEYTTTARFSERVDHRAENLGGRVLN